MSVLAKRRGQIVEEIHSPDSPLCLIRAHMPVNESFGEHAYKFLLLLISVVRSVLPGREKRERGGGGVLLLTNYK